MGYRPMPLSSVSLFLTRGNDLCAIGCGGGNRVEDEVAAFLGNLCTIRRGHYLGDITMSNWRSVKLGSIAILAAVLAGGCSSSSKPPEGISVEATDNDLMDFSAPQVKISGGVMTISGTVTRKPGVHDAINGRVDIDVIAANGEELAWLPALLTPTPVPDDEKGESTYIVNYGMVPPAGTTVQVHFVDQATATQEDINNSELGGYGGGGHAHASFHSAGGHEGGHMGW
jgi:hypothetical protein